MYNIHSCITCTPNFEQQNHGKKMGIIHTNFLEFVAAKFSICSTFYWSILIKNKNLYSLYYVLKQKFTQYLEQTCSYKIQAFNENKFT